MLLSSAQAKVSVAAASSLRFVLPEIVAAYGKDKVVVSYGSSGSLFAQLKNGAPYQLFLSADSYYVSRLQGIRGSLRTFGRGRLALWWPAGSCAKVLTDNCIKRLAIANYKYAPYGKATVAWLKKQRIYSSLKNKLLIAEDASMAIQYASQFADGGILPLSVVRSPRFAKFGGEFIALPDTKIEREFLQHQMLLIKKDAEARKFWLFMTSPIAKRILRRHGL